MITKLQKVNYHVIVWRILQGATEIFSMKCVDNMICFMRYDFAVCLMSLEHE
uniref:Uncharacterized protein n=1 Tax=Arion vulgaris TaxID=1028688 RepID=A0A0B7BNY5_9EUPU